MTVPLLVPRRAGDPHRDRVWRFCRGWWEQHGYTNIVEGCHDEGPFNRSAAANTAARLAGDWTVAAVLDADVIFDARQLGIAITLAESTGAPALAYTDRTHLSKRMTDQVMAGYQGDWSEGRKFVKHDSCSSANVIRRDLWDAVGGYDERFVGWGWEDVAFKHATETLSQQGTHRIPGMCWHLWHPTGPEINLRHPQTKRNEIRHQRYKSALGDIPAMRALLDE